MAADSVPIPTLPPIAWLEFHARLRAGGTLPEFLGSALRGAFGRGLRQVACAQGGGCGSQCRAPETCAVAHLFEQPPLPPGLVPTRFRQPPHPLALRATLQETESVHPGQDLVFGWTLLRPAWRWIPAIHRAVGWIADAGLGANRLRFEVVAARTRIAPDRTIPASPVDTQPHPYQAPPPPDGTVTITLDTPLRLQTESQPLRTWDTGEFLRAVVRRLWLLAEFYGGERGHPPDAQTFAVRTLRHDTRWEDRKRFSSRQGRDVPWGGLLGSVQLAQVPPALAHLLRVAELLNVGKGTSMGLGRISLSPDSRGPA